MEPTSFITSQLLRLFISLLFLFGAIKYRRYFLFTIPVLQYAGYVLMVKNRLPEFNFIISYAELSILFIFALQEGFRFKDKTSVYLFFFPFLSLPSLLFAQGNFYQTLFILCLLSMSAFLYIFLLKRMQWLLVNKSWDIAALSWISYGLITKILQGFKWAVFLSPGSPLLWTIFNRSGGIGASNSVGGVILIFLPLIRDYRVLILCNLFLLTTFSRGVYICLFLFWIVRIVQKFDIRGNIRIKRNFLRGLMFSCLILFLIWGFIIPQDIKQNISTETYNRIIGSAYWGATVGEKILARFKEADRLNIYMQALDILKETSYQGIGLGGFAWGQELIGVTREYSNAHNLYLTLLSEGGFFFLLGFLGLLAYMFILAFRYSRDAFLSLIMFSAYGMFSGQLYEAASLVSCYIYYYLIFLLAYLTHLKRFSGFRGNSTR